jgi:hypothetical protein
MRDASPPSTEGCSRLMDRVALPGIIDPLQKHPYVGRAERANTGTC